MHHPKDISEEIVFLPTIRTPFQLEGYFRKSSSQENLVLNNAASLDYCFTTMLSDNVQKKNVSWLGGLKKKWRKRSFSKFFMGNTFK